MARQRRVDVVIKGRDELSQPAGLAERAMISLKGSLFSVQGAVAGLVGGAGIGLLGQRMIRLASDAAEAGTKFTAVFKDQTEAAETFMNELAESVNRSRFAIGDYLSALQDTFVPMGFTRDIARELSQTMTRLAIDVASFQNATDAETIERFQAALVGGHRQVLRYGIVINQATLSQELMNLGLADSALKATEQQKVLARLSLIVKGTSDAHGDATRTAASFANQLKGLRADVEELATEMGQILLPAVQDVVAIFRQELTRDFGFKEFLQVLVDGFRSALFGFRNIAQGFVDTVRVMTNSIIASVNKATEAMATLTGASPSPNPLSDAITMIRHPVLAGQFIFSEFLANANLLAGTGLRAAFGEGTVGGNLGQGFLRTQGIFRQMEREAAQRLFPGGAGSQVTLLDQLGLGEIFRLPPAIGRQLVQADPFVLPDLGGLAGAGGAGRGAGHLPASRRLRAELASFRMGGTLQDDEAQRMRRVQERQAEQLDMIRNGIERGNEIQERANDILNRLDRNLPIPQLEAPVF